MSSFFANHSSLNRFALDQDGLFSHESIMRETGNATGDFSCPHALNQVAQSKVANSIAKVPVISVTVSFVGLPLNVFAANIARHGALFGAASSSIGVKAFASNMTKGFGAHIASGQARGATNILAKQQASSSAAIHEVEQPQDVMPSSSSSRVKFGVTQSQHTVSSSSSSNTPAMVTTGVFSQLDVIASQPNNMARIRVCTGKNWSWSLSNTYQIMTMAYMPKTINSVINLGALCIGSEKIAEQRLSENEFVNRVASSMIAGSIAATLTLLPSMVSDYMVLSSQTSNNSLRRMTNLQFMQSMSAYRAQYGWKQSLYTVAERSAKTLPLNIIRVGLIFATIEAANYLLGEKPLVAVRDRFFDNNQTQHSSSEDSKESYGAAKPSSR